jgi:hypothetical protein
MNRTQAIMSVAGGIVLGVLVSGSLPEAGADPWHGGLANKHFECSNELLKGTYGVQMQGVRPLPGGTSETVIGVVIRTFDGEGGFTQIDHFKGSTTGLVPDRPGSGTYAVNADCSGITRFAPAPGILIEERMVVVDFGHEIRTITSTPAPIMVTAVAKRTGVR